MTPGWAPGQAPSGRFITLEGGEGAGKSTQAAHLAVALAGRGLSPLVTREPGGSAGAEAIRALLVEGEPDRWDAVTEALLLYAARRDHVRRTIAPALARGEWVICDRFADSTLAYQGYGHGLDRTVITSLHRLAIGELQPDLTVILDLPAAEGLARAAARPGAAARYERLDTAFHERLRQGFLEIARREPERCVVIDAAASVEAVAAAVLDAVGTRLGLR